MTKHHLHPILEKHSEAFHFLYDLSVTPEGISDLIPKNFGFEEVKNDLELLKSNFVNLPSSIDELIKQFRTWLWTLFGEIAVPDDLGKYGGGSWPVLCFPLAEDIDKDIEKYIQSQGCIVSSKNEIWMNQLLHACLYAGQPWYAPLRDTYIAEFGLEKHKTQLLWINTNSDSKCTSSAMARKLQLHARPKLPSKEVKVKGRLYPGVIRAFHSPKLENVTIHRILLSQEVWL